MSKDFRIILASSKPDLLRTYQEEKYKVVALPLNKLSRHSKIRHILILTVAKGHIREKDKIVCVSGGIKKSGELGSITILNICKQFKEIMDFKKYSGEQNIPLTVLESVLDTAIRLGALGRKRSTIGAIFVVGDAREVLKLSKQLVFNPFKGYEAKEKNIKNPLIRQSIYELAKLDGAFIVRDDGMLCAAGRLLLMPKSQVKILKGLGARHNAAAYVTKKTKSVAVVVSQSSGAVSIFSRGKLLFRLTAPES